MGLELSVSNNAHAVALESENRLQTTSFSVHPGRLPACHELQKIGEAEYMRARLRDATGWMASHPGRTAQLTLQRIYYFWIAPVDPWFFRVFQGAISLLAIAGCLVAFRSSAWAGAFLTSTFLLFPALLYFLQAHPRYREPVQPVLDLAAGTVIVLLARKAAPVFEREYEEVAAGSGRRPAIITPLSSLYGGGSPSRGG